MPLALPLALTLRGLLPGRLVDRDHPRETLAGFEQPLGRRRLRDQNVDDREHSTGLRWTCGDETGPDRELLACETEYPELDFKTTINPGTTAGVVEFAVHVGAMQVHAGYIVGGVDGRGVPCDGLKHVDLRLFDEATLRAKLSKYLPEPLALRAAVHDVDGHAVALILVGHIRPGARSSGRTGST